MFPMNISSIAASTPVQPATAVQPQKPDATNDQDANDAGAAQPTVQPPLPPGQGTRINQLV
jgi:hypothetical protein